MIKTNHRFLFKNSNNMSEIADNSVDLVVTSPPYPMIEMWDDMFANLGDDIKEALSKNDGRKAFELMNRQLDQVWNEVYRILKEGGFACINIGDATRTINGHFMLYPNHSRILSHMLKTGFTPLPEILWRKQSNAPNKFMGSGMMPAGAYVTQEHEYILILRKGGKKAFDRPDEKKLRRESSFFWEERNLWFSDIWTDLKGTPQKTKGEKIRERSAAYPFELPYRLINMYSVKGDTIVDPFFGMGTTMLAAMATGRNSVGYEISPEFSDPIVSRTETLIELAGEQVEKRLENHAKFVKERIKSNKPFKHENRYYGFPVVTRQETDLLLEKPVGLDRVGSNEFEVTYAPHPAVPLPISEAAEPARTRKERRPIQLSIF